MGDISSGCTIREVAPNLAHKLVFVETAATADNGDTILVTLANYGMTTFKFIRGAVHTTENSVIIEEAPTTSVSAGVLTIVIGGSLSNKVRIYEIAGI